ncbi:hypothetical protein P153DRAFT_382776 [Dothidotthia symphoricarpi CBS 119687]|uniref:Uncharacterized protein n=1 Tax=Dothidotthia symphoricarpi CBS 119687 TaxID=1392245 RepID=A0A6A6AK12_9PLEO|nr:uncharacterized protein P153DRAFT_382776 [Dothidotthia symphoricarpi CBS 119687]KAF2131886.1 hypothetical protein P153DRAFT_382776 [Dothidotthia symphoricarpi CBS 119687]
MRQQPKHEDQKGMESWSSPPLNPTPAARDWSDEAFDDARSSGLFPAPGSHTATTTHLADFGAGPRLRRRGQRRRASSVVISNRFVTTILHYTQYAYESLNRTQRLAMWQQDVFTLKGECRDRDVRPWLSLQGLRLCRARLACTLDQHQSPSQSLGPISDEGNSHPILAQPDAVWLHATCLSHLAAMHIPAMLQEFSSFAQRTWTAVQLAYLASVDTACLSYSCMSHKP